MNATVEDLRGTIVPRSDQLNADQLLGGPMVVRVGDVKLGSTSEQPVTVHYEGDGGRPFKPCLTMRRVLILAWGANGRLWKGRSLELYSDPDVRFGNDKVGGVRIRAMSHIPQPIEVRLTATKGKKALHRIEKLVDGDQELIDAMKAADAVDALKEVFAKAYRTTKDEGRRAAFKAEYDRRMAELAPSALLTEYLQKLADAANSDDAGQLLDEARTTLNPTEQAELNKAFAARFGDS